MCTEHTNERRVIQYDTMGYTFGGTLVPCQANASLHIWFRTHTTIYTHTDAYMQQTLIYRAVCIHHLLHDSFNDYIYLSVRGILSL